MNVSPSTIVDRFFLTPVSGGIRVTVEMRSDHVVRERGKLFDTRNGDILDATFLTFSEESEVDLSGTEDVSNDFFGSDETFRFSFGDVSLEVGIGTELFEGRARLRVTEEVLREEDDEGFSVVAVDLSSESVENVGRNGRVDELQVAVLMLTNEFLRSRVDEGVVVTELEESLDTSRRVFGTLSVVSVR